MSELTRRTLLAGVAAATAVTVASAAKRSWRPKLGILGKYTPANLDFAKTEGFTSMGFWSNRGDTLDANKVTDETLASVRDAVKALG